MSCARPAPSHAWQRGRAAPRYGTPSSPRPGPVGAAFGVLPNPSALPIALSVSLLTEIVTLCETVAPADSPALMPCVDSVVNPSLLNVALCVVEWLMPGFIPCDAVTEPVTPAVPAVTVALTGPAETVTDDCALLCDAALP